jgi:hypothetical protein
LSVTPIRVPEESNRLTSMKEKITPARPRFREPGLYCRLF